MIPPMKLKLGTTSMGSSHQAQETCSRDTNSFLSLETDVPHSGQNTASLRIAARQALQEYKGFAQYWQKLASGVFLPHVGHLTVSAILRSRILLNRLDVNIVGVFCHRLAVVLY